MDVRFAPVNGMASVKKSRRLLHGRRALTLALGIAICVSLLAALVLGAPGVAYARPNLGLNSAADCSQLARQDPTATNGSAWGRTVLPGHNAPHGWFGVDVCSNGLNISGQGSSGVSRDGAGHPTSDGYGWTFQCPELVVRFATWAFGDSPAEWGRSGWGNAPDLWLPVNHPADFVAYPNGSSHPPVPGDILVWGYLDKNGNPWPAGPNGQHDGHVAVVAAVRDGTVITAEENVSWGSQDHPSDTLALSLVGKAWILSGTSQPATTLPTYRWPRTMGLARGTFGWLHSVKNNGTFPNQNAEGAAPKAKTPAPAPTATPTKPAAASAATPTATPSPSASAPTPETPGGLPSLDAAVAVTADGHLADLAWSTTAPFAPTGQTHPPTLQSRDLGAPPGSTLAAGQTPTAVMFPSGQRDIYALGADGHLFAATTTATSLGIFWNDLGTPEGVRLVGSPVADMFFGNAAVVALGADGNLWWHIQLGPPGSPGSWLPLDTLGGTTLTFGFALVPAPGSEMPLVLAVGGDGNLYERAWQTTGADSGSSVPAGWSPWALLGGPGGSARFGGVLRVVASPDGALNLFVADSTGVLWWLRSADLRVGWAPQQFRTPLPIQSLLAVAPVPTSPAGGTPQQDFQLHLYVAADTPYLGVLTLPASSTRLPQPPAWTALPAFPAGPDAAVAETAVPLAAGTSALLAAHGSHILVGGTAEAVAALQPSASDKPTAGWIAVGAIAPSAAFDDGLTGTSLDERWQPLSGDESAASDSPGLRVAVGTSGPAGERQLAAPGDAALAVRVTVPAKQSSNSAAGLMLYLDDGDWVSLVVTSAGDARLCAMAWQQASACSSVSSIASAPGSAVWLRLSRAGSLYTGEASRDGVTWQQIGTWTPAAPPAAQQGTTQTAGTPSPTAPPSPTVSPSPSATPTATPGAMPGAMGALPTSGTTSATSPAAPLAFTSWGLLVQGASGGSAEFSQFTIGYPGGAASLGGSSLDSPPRSIRDTVRERLGNPPR